MEIGYEDKTQSFSFESLDRKFLDEITKLTKEQYDAEDAENARHREKISEINSRYQEKLSALRAQQGNRREDIFHKESNKRLDQYHPVNMHYSSSSLHDVRGYTTAGEVNRASATNQIDSYRNQPPFYGSERAPRNEGWVPYPEGRVYNNNTGPPYY